MKRFDKGYIYSNLLTDLIGLLVLPFLFLEDIFFDESTSMEDAIAAIPFFAIAFVVIYLCLVAYRILYYRTSGYELTETEIKCKKGVFFKKRSILDYKNVHAINKKQNLIHRLFGIAILTVDSGSANTGHQAEITIIEKGKTVDALLSKLNALKEGSVQADHVTDSPEEVLLSDKDSLYCFTSKKKLLYTLINIVSTAFFTALLGVLTTIVLGACKGLLQLDLPGTWGEYFLYAVLITAGAMLLFSMLSFITCMVQSFVNYHHFTITKQDHHILISYGLLVKHTNTFSYDRIKAIKISQGPVQRLLGFASIKLEVIGYTVEDNDSTEPGILVPFCRYSEINEILGKILPAYIPNEKQTKAVSFFPFVSWFLLIFGIITGVVLAGTIAVMTLLNASAFLTTAIAWSIAGAAAIVIALKLISAILSYHTNGLGIDHGKITVYSGGFIKTVTVFMAKHLIAVENVATPLRQKKGIATLVMHLKTNDQSNEVKVHIQKDALSKALENALTL